MRMFSRLILLKNHREYAHRPDSKCKYCGKEFALERELRLHEARHKRSKNGDMGCSYCGKSFMTKV